jgi:hypothetical protein
VQTFLMAGLITSHLRPHPIPNSGSRANGVGGQGGAGWQRNRGVSWGGEAGYGHHPGNALNELTLDFHDCYGIGFCFLVLLGDNKQKLTEQIVADQLLRAIFD